MKEFYRRHLPHWHPQDALFFVTFRLKDSLPHEVIEVPTDLATVQAIASKSLRSAQNIEEGRRAIESRLRAIGRIHDLLLQTNWSKAKLGAGRIKLETGGRLELRHDERVRWPPQS